MAAEQVFSRRLDSVRRQLREQGVDCLALVPGSNLRYLTGMHFHLMERALIVFVPVDAEPVLVLPALEVLNWQSGAPFGGRIFSWDDSRGPEEAMREAAKALPQTKTIAVERLRMRVLEHDLVRRYLPNAETVMAETVMDPVRMSKDPAEIDSLRRAIRISDAALEEVISGVAPGITEREVSGRLSAAMLLRGGESVDIEPQVVSGQKSALPHGATADRPVESGDIVLIDFVTAVNGYHSDITRTFVVGQSKDARLGDVYRAVLEANAAGRRAVRPGVTCHEVDRAVRAVIEDAGLGECFTHRAGHGLGLDIHEAPSVVSGNDMRLDVGMVFTIEPGVYIEGWGGVRIEDDVVVTEDGCESLTSFSRELTSVGAYNVH